MIIRLKIGDIIEKDFEIKLEKYNKVRYDFKLDYNITKFSFYLYLLNEKNYYDEKLEYLKKHYLIIKRLDLKCFL